ncbi:TonB-dependent receptor plug domain-containing protein [soil metagenome]
MRLLKSIALTLFATGFLISPHAVLAQQGVDLDNVNLNDLLDFKIQSASKQSEPWAEVPVPVSVITGDMLKFSGVRTVGDALVMFVPGYTFSQDRNEPLFSTRGIYATAQQKVLILINGHRLNSRSYLTSEPDFGIALHNLERIEVLRGPGSSLYGNVALSGVVNLITKKGKDVHGNMVEVGAGNNGQMRTRMLTGDGGDDWDVLAWGQIYKASGEVHTLDGSEKYNTGKTGDIRIGGVDHTPAHDFGVTYRRGKWTFMGASRQSQYIEPYGSGNNTYNYGDFRTYDGHGPGLGMGQQHLDAKYNSAIGDGWTFEFNPYYDRSKIQGNIAAAGGGGNTFNWQDQSVGVTAQVNRDYATDFGSGTFLFGAQIDTFTVDDSIVTGYTNGEITAPTDNKTTRLLDTGGEDIYSLFVQDKHKFTSEWILNLGGRYDSKTRKGGETFQKLSPRLALIYLPNSTYEYKLSYSQSFVDAPYWYRFNRGLASFGGSEQLNPEVLEAIQLQAVWKSSDKRLRNAATFFYQNGSNLIVNRATAAGTPADPKYINSGKIESAGLENEFSWQETSHQVFWNLTYSQAMAAVDFARFDSKFAHVPQVMSNLIFNYLYTREISANVSVQYVGDQVFNSGSLAVPVATTVDAAVLLNLGARFENIFSSGAFFDARMYNALGTEWYQGGQSGTQIPFRQQGRWYFASVGREF